MATYGSYWSGTPYVHMKEYYYNSNKNNIFIGFKLSRVSYMTAIFQVVLAITSDLEKVQ